MTLDESVKLIRTKGGECFICDVPLRPNEIAVEVSFKWPLLITSTIVKKEGHLSCMADLGVIVNRRLAEAGYKRQPR
jgi:hypothetical protein